MTQNDFYRFSIDKVVESVRTDLNAGLGDDEVKKRFIEFGPNELRAAHRASPWVLFFAQFKNILIQILLVATLLSVFMGHAMEAVAIAVIVLFAVLLSFGTGTRLG